MDSIYPANPFRRTEEQRERYEAEQADRQIAALERIADALETGIQPPWLIDMLKTHTEQIGTLTYKVDKLTGGKSVVDLLMEGTVSPE
jgi:hypothetical protein